MKRIGKIWDNVVAVADVAVRDVLRDERYTFHPLRRMICRKPKERVIDYATDSDKKLLKAVHEVLAPKLANKMESSTYSSIKGRGLTQCAKQVARQIRRHAYYVQVDVRKFYQSIPHDKLKAQLRQYVKDSKALRFLDAVVDNHTDGVAIGLSLSSYLANLYLTDIDRWLVGERLKAVRYMDDIVVFCDSKSDGKRILQALTERLAAKGLRVKGNARISPTAKGLIFIGYKFYPTHTLLRKNIREAIKKRHRALTKAGVSDKVYKRAMASYFGWMIHANCRHFMRKTMGERYKLFEKNIMKYDRLKNKRAIQNYFGLPREKRVSVRDLLGKDIIIFESTEVEIFKETKAAIRFAFVDNDEDVRFTLTRSDVVMDRLKRDASEFPAVVTFCEKVGANGRKYICYE